MATSKQFDRIAALVTALAVLLTILFINGEALGIEKIIDEDAQQYKSTTLFTDNDRNGSWDVSRATATVTLLGDSAKISGNGAYYNDGSVVITGAGYYVFSGALTDGNIVVDAYQSSKVFLMLNGVELYCSDDACLRVDQAEKVFLTLAEGTQNRMESGGTYSQTALDDNTGGTIFAHDDLTVNGSGSLDIVANYKHGVDANDDLVLTGGTISVTAPSDGLHVNDSFRMTEASLSVSAGDDGIHSDSDIYIESGTLLISACYEGLEALRIEVAGGDITVYPTDDGFNANGGSGGFGFGGMMGGGMGRFGRGGDSTEEASGERPDFSGERPEFDGELPDFSGEMPAPPDWEEADGERPARPEGFDGQMPDQESQGGQDSGQTGAEESGAEEETYIRISGGSILIINENAQDADGLDSNGDIEITGGTIRISLNGDGSNNAIDYGSESGGTATISGGTIIACGGSAMAESFDDSSAQPCIAYTASASAGTAVTLKASDGAALLSWEVPCSFTYLTLSCPEMTLGATYTLSVGDSEESVTLEETVTSLGSSSKGFGGFGGFGGFSGFDGSGGKGGGRRRFQSGSEETAETGVTDSIN